MSRLHHDGAREDVAELDAMIEKLDKLGASRTVKGDELLEVVKMVKHLRVLIDDLFAEVER